MKSESVGGTQSKAEMRETREGPGKANDEQVDRLNSLMEKKKSRNGDGGDGEPGDMEASGGEAVAAGRIQGGMGELFTQAMRNLGSAGAEAGTVLSAGLSGMNAGVDAPMVAVGKNAETGMPAKMSESDDGGDTVLAQMNPLAGRADFGGAMAVSGEDATVEHTAPVQIKEIAERILVSAPGPDGASEVRIRIDPKMLPDTEIAMKFVPGEVLSVEIMTDRVEVQRFLLPNLSELRERLAERTGGEVAVHMSENASADTGDGRSRNRRNVYEEMGNDQPV